LLIQSLEDIQELNQYSQKRTPSKVGNFRLKFQGNDLFKFGNVKSIGEKFPYACVNFIDIELVEQMLKGEKDYKGVPIIITIDNIGKLPLDKLSNIEKKFDVLGVRIIEKNGNVKYGPQIRPIDLAGYKQIRAVVDNEIINKLYVVENMNKIGVDSMLAAQIICLIVDKVTYDEKFKEKSGQLSIEECSSYFLDVSSIIGLVTGKTICGGYSEILRNVLSCVGIKSKTIIGESSNGNGHAWNQIELGDTWFNADVTWAAKQIREGEPSGELFMSDIAFFGDFKNMTFDSQKCINGENMENEVISGGHRRAFNTNCEKCDCYLSPYITTTLIRKTKEYEEDYKKYGKSSNYKGAVPYIGSNIEKTRSNTKNIETSEPSK
jgi:hypothetical protein